MTYLRIARDVHGRPKALTHSLLAGGERVRVTADPVECSSAAIIELARSNPMVEIVTPQELLQEAETAERANPLVQALKAAQAATDVGPVEADVPAVATAVEVDVPPTAESVGDLDVPNAKTADVLEWVGDSPERAGIALEHERAKGDGARTGLTSALEEIAS